MSVVLNRKLIGRFASELAEQEAATVAPKVCLVADSPNVTRTVEAVYGKGSRPDLAAVLKIGRRYGFIHEATIVANPGLPNYIADRFERLGFSVDRGRGPDCDDRVISKCVRAALVADTLVCMGGDHCMVDVIRLVKNQRRAVNVVVIGVNEKTAACLKDSCDEYISLPILPYSIDLRAVSML